MAGGGHAPEVLVDGGRHGAQVALAGEQLAEGVADVDGVDAGAAHPSVGQRLADDLGVSAVERLALACEVAGEVALVAPEHPDPLLAHVLLPRQRRCPRRCALGHVRAYRPIAPASYAGPVPSPARHLAVAAVALVIAAAALAGCGGGEQHVALAVRDTAWVSATELAVTTECAEVTEATFEPAAGAQPATLTIWGDPKLGTCDPALVIPVPAGTTKVVDAASSEVVDLPPRPGV